MCIYIFNAKYVCIWPSSHRLKSEDGTYTSCIMSIHTHFNLKLVAVSTNRPFSPQRELLKSKDTFLKGAATTFNYTSQEKQTCEKQGCFKILHHIAPIFIAKIISSAQGPLGSTCSSADMVSLPTTRLSKTWLNSGCRAKFACKILSWSEKKETKTRILEAKILSLIKRSGDEALKWMSFVRSFWEKYGKVKLRAWLTFNRPNVTFNGTYSQCGSIWIHGTISTIAMFLERVKF